ncbi:MAG: DUF192 domain-containing protein [Candidatus Zambryskibacteria bacterium]|nr:DUF192 domain-containing protein [Candidatus Zambryskibacteria bacterium]
MRSDKIFFILVAVVVILAIFVRYNAKSEVILNGKVFQVEVVSTQSALEKGLSGHKLLEVNQGMFFIFQKPDNYGFWMKDMTFPIDIIWLDSSFKVVHVEKSLLPETYPKTFYSNAPSLYVLEVLAGISDKINLKIGDTIKFIKN